ncbi:hypothetical protein N7468_007033 [Penicillium chermesinum]|uniref:RRM domain-containing protein n=1 Tax=Penicillium chermesinum TaxID=63820 RepID=A0A9W9NTQ5_9EURO|nr:uncharacterized protein N7468_007033 [Penicillium chermesinum]KAJ5225808.1 hypothetical protein N7468_007033 [Penicillium chermesinum]
MSFPPPPGLQKAPSSLPPRPPTTGGGSGNARPNSGAPFTGFQPRAQPQPSYQSGPAYYGTAYNDPTSYGQPAPQAANPYAVASHQPYGAQYGQGAVDPQTQAQMAQWQSAYSTTTDDYSTKARDSKGAVGAARGAPTPTAGNSTPAPKPEKTVVRSGGGKTWTDDTLAEWDPAHFRLFVGNLAGEVTDDSLFKAFSKYASLQKARVVREKSSQKSKGYGFVSFSDGDDYFKAGREMQGKYINSRPVLLRRATAEVKPVSTKSLNKNNKPKKDKKSTESPSATTIGKVKHDGVKKPAKTKGGLKILG